MITTLLSSTLLLTNLVLLGLVALLALQTFSSFLPERTPPKLSETDVSLPSTVVLMPAHDEAEIIESIVRQAVGELPSGARLLVVADNCTDDTAERARSAGADVLERFNPAQRGKSYALAHGVAHLASRPPEVVIVMDADCVAAPDSLSLLASTAHHRQRPVQAKNIVESPRDADLMRRIAAFAWDFRTQVRVEGYQRLGLPCQLMGTGMAFPWLVLQKMKLANGHLTEDLKLGLDCALIDKAPQYLARASVSSPSPSSVQGASTQRERWEHGHLTMIVSQAPGLLWKSIGHRNFSLFALTLDLCVPPLAVLVILVGIQTMLAGALTLSGLAWPMVAALSLATLALLTLTMAAGWWRVGRRWVGFGELLSVPFYILRKFPIYLAFLTRRQTSWIRTKRGK